MTSPRGERLPIQAFRVDPGWYADYWLAERPARPPGLWARLCALAVAAVPPLQQAWRSGAGRRVERAILGEARPGLR
jgi:hypothetical protein